MKTTRLHVEYDYDFIVFAVVSSAKPYKLAWELNNSLQYHLIKAKDLHFNFIKEGEIYITNYIHKAEYWCLRLLKNKSCEFDQSLKPYLVPELKEYDYIIHYSGEISIFEPTLLIGQIKKVPLIEYINEINVEKLKSKENLIF